MPTACVPHPALRPLMPSSPTHWRARVMRPPRSSKRHPCGERKECEPLLHEWRGALFRVRLARLRLATPPKTPPEPPRAAQRVIVGPLVAFLLALFGAVAFVAGATLGLWPVWGLGMVAVCGSVFAYRP